MKHVFVINSHTTFLTSIGVVNSLKLNDKNVYFIYTRHYSNKVTPITFNVINGTEIADACRSIGVDYEGYIRKVDDFIKQNIYGRYVLYVPHLWNYFFQLLYTNKACRKVSYVQEGGPAQTNVYDNNVPLLERLKSFVRHALLGRRTFECKWYKRGTLYKQMSLDSYAINNEYFRCLPSHNHIVEWPKQKLNLTINREWPIFIFDGHVTNGLVEKDIYMHLCEEIINQTAKENNYVKFHPAQSSDERESIITFFSNRGHHAEVMNDDIPIEYVIIQFKNLKFIGFTSSLLYYAHDYGHMVICNETKLTEASDTYRRHVKECGFQTYSETYGQ